MKTTYVPGKWLAICDVCGLRFYNDQLKKDWRDLMVCKHDFELRHPQDFLKVYPDSQNVPWGRPEAPDLFVPINFTQSITEPLLILEGMGLNLQKIIIPVYISTGAINSWAINERAINANSPVNSSSSEAILLLETFTFTNGRVFNETLSIIESLLFKLLSGTATNGSALNSTSIG